MWPAERVISGLNRGCRGSSKEDALDRRIVGIDLGITSAHAVVVIDGAGKVLGRRRCRPTLECLAAVEELAQAGAPPDCRLEVVMEATGPAWLPVAVFFVRRGHRVFRVSSAKAAALRRFLFEHAKTNGIDVLTLAKAAIVDPEHLCGLELAGDAATAGLDRRCRAAEVLTDQIGDHKVRIRDLLRHVMPTVDEVFTNKFGHADLAVAERYGDPRLLVRLGEARLARFIARISKGHHGLERAQAWLAAANNALELFGDDPAIAFEDLAAEIATEARILRLLMAEHDRHAQAREDHYAKVDPDGLARSLPGIATIGGPMLVSAMGRAGRFPNAAAFKKFTGLTPKASATGDSDRKGQSMTKAGPRRLRSQLFLSANTARTIDPQLAAVYYTQMVERGAHHHKAVCVVAARLAERAWVVMSRGQPYVVRDLDGRPVNMTEAKAIIAERYTVPAQVRARTSTRRKRAGRAPQQVLTAHG